MLRFWLFSSAILSFPDYTPDLKKVYEYIIIDSPPSLTLLTVNAISAADSLLIPLQCEFYAFESIRHLLHTVRILKKHFNPGLKIIGILLTMFELNEKISRQIGIEARNHFNDIVFTFISVFKTL